VSARKLFSFAALGAGFCRASIAFNLNHLEMIRIFPKKIAAKTLK
jgi:hypothetical protein